MMNVLCTSKMNTFKQLQSRIQMGLSNFHGLQAKTLGYGSCTPNIILIAFKNYLTFSVNVVQTRKRLSLKRFVDLVKFQESQAHVPFKF